LLRNGQRENGIALASLPALPGFVAGVVFALLFVCEEGESFGGFGVNHSFREEIQVFELVDGEKRSPFLVLALVPADPDFTIGIYVALKFRKFRQRKSPRLLRALPPTNPCFWIYQETQETRA